MDQSPVTSLNDLNATQSYRLNKTWIAPTATQAVFVPIHTATQRGYITGAPRLSLQVEIPSKVDPTLFISMAIKSKLTGKYEVLNDQTAPFNAARKQAYDQITQDITQLDEPHLTIELPSMNGRLNQGDTLGLLINTQSMYYQKIKQPKIEAWISGHIVLPKFWSETASK